MPTLLKYYKLLNRKIGNKWKSKKHTTPNNAIGIPNKFAYSLSKILEQETIAFISQILWSPKNLFILKTFFQKKSKIQKKKNNK